ncbi:MAG: TSUP family transporter [Bacteroidota bacterium]
MTNKKETLLDTNELSPLSKDGNNLFPIFLKLEHLSILIVGGGYVGNEKLTAVLQNSPATRVRLVATQISEEIRSFSLGYNVELIERPYQSSDIDEADIVIAALNDRVVSEQVAADARAKGKLINVADKPELCDFYLSSVVQKGSIKIAISTNGKSPTIAKRLKEVLNKMIPDEMESVLDNLQQVRKRMNGSSFEAKVKKLNELTEVLVTDAGADELEKPATKHWRKIATYSVIVFALMLIGHWIFSYVPLTNISGAIVSGYHSLDKNFPWMVLAGFLAQMVDGATSMGYGVTSSIVLQTASVNPAAISAGIHTAEMFTSGASGYSHYKFGNVNKKMFKALVIPGIIGAVLGAILLVKFDDTHIKYLRPAMAIYTLLLGIKIFANAFMPLKTKQKFKHYGWLAGAGGFLDSFGGGGWGPIVTSTLITKGRTPRFVVGSVSLTEFFVTLASAFTFFTLIGVQNWQVILALVIGGVIAAPFAAKLAGKLPRKTSFILLGTVVIFWSIRILYKLF